MKAVKLLTVLFLVAGVFILPAWWLGEADPEENDPDLPAGVKIDKGEYRRLRDEHYAMLRGVDSAKQDSRNKAVREMEASERALAAGGEGVTPGSWRFLGPAPIPNGQVTGGGTIPVSGRTIAIAVHPTNPDIVYTGTAQGGLYRSLNGGTSWTPLMDGALSLEIGSIAIVPTDPTTLFVGTGEAGFCGDCFFGAGVYRITNAESANPTVSGPFTLDASSADVFTGRAAGKVLVHPTDPNIIYVTTASGTAGIHGSTTGAVLPPRGLYRSSNAMSASPVFERLTVSGAAIDRPMLDAVFEPGDPNHMFVTLVDTTGAADGGVYFSTNALAAAPTFTRLLTTGVGAELGRAELAIQKTGNTVTVYCGHGTGNGQVSKTTYDTTAPGTPAFTLAVDNNFCNGQCFYDQAIAVDPADPNRVYLGGSPTLPFGISINGGTSFTSSSNTLHVDTHAIAVSPSTPTTLYFGSDGGIWKSINGGTTWVSQNNSTYSATQFVSLAVHPSDRHYTLGGTQDNGTEYLFPDGLTWTRSVGGDGGFVVIDGNSASPTSMVSYHTFFNSSGSQIGFARSTTNQANGNPIYGGLLGCGGTANGINCADATLFYAPLALGPNAPGSTGNTVYFGSNKLYRSINQGTTMTAVSQTLPGANERVSAIAMSPQNDDIRLIGSTAGRLYYSNTAAATTMTDIAGTFPARLVGRVAIDPTNPNIAYAALGGFGIPNQHVMKTTNLDAATPTWANSGVGIPDVPTNGLVIDPADPNTLYVGTDIGVFQSTDAGANWVPFSSGLPRVAVFEIKIQPTRRILKIATHGRGIWEFNLDPHTAPADFDGDGRTDRSVFRPSDGNWYLNRSTDGFAVIGWGLATDTIVPGDYDGDGKADTAVFRPAADLATPDYYILNSNGFTVTGQSWGLLGDIPVGGDYDGDGKTDPAVFRPSEAAWYVRKSAGGETVVGFGLGTDVPLAVDNDGDGKTNLAVFRPSDNTWYIAKSTGIPSQNYDAIPFGLSGDLLVPANYDGDAKDDIAVFRPSNGSWYILRSSNGQLAVTQFGLNGDVPVPGDYDGDGSDDIAIYRGGTWHVLQSASGYVVTPFGIASDTPVPKRYIP